MRRWIYRLNINQRMLFYFSTVIIVAITVASWLIYQEATTQIQKQTRVYLEHIAKNTSYQTDRYISRLELASLSLLNNRFVKGFLDLEDHQEYDRYNYTQEIKKEMQKISIQNNDINLIYLVGENGKVVLSEDRPISLTEWTSNYEIYEHLKKITPDSGQISILGNPSIYDKAQYVISMSRQTRGMASFVPKGILGFDIDAIALEKLWNIGQLKNDTSLWIMDPEGKIVYHSNANLLGKKVAGSLQERLSQQAEGSFIDLWEDERTLFYYTTSIYTGWTLIAMAPESAILEPVSGVKKNALVASAIAILFAVIFSFVFTRSIVKPLRKVQNGMRKMEKGEWEMIKPLQGNDEISSVVHSYNKMIQRLSQLVEDLYKSELRNQRVLIEKQKSELQALQSQINPHFLHNTLETMNAYAILNDADEISEMAEALSSMFRYSVRNFEVVTLQEELEHVKNFLVVQEHRFQKKIGVHLHIPPHLEREEMVKLSLQPLVENAIHHGLRKKGYRGEIHICASVTENTFTIQVCDDGAGITEERLQEINNRLKAEESFDIDKNMGIGVSNVHRRIQLIYGHHFGLHITGNEDEGTTVTLTFPRNEWTKDSA
ncbi:sensor histidine kinase [Bacillus sp. FJAT-50079]|uniref:sensor histidine kinase n=1 Tax=Bacillus sp. FJAT-50079 TaxID=2833577 RepID=UPI001BC95787|nr:sensor histidine kinase [Bacillus sp. FJAT-50079]MBS4208860.1 sensor histidine kinase [Bacillus sp. FJAT-50079]